MSNKLAVAAKSEVKILTTQMACPRCETGVILEVYLDGHIMAFYCGNTPHCCGLRFAVRQEFNPLEGAVDYYGVPYNPDFPVGTLVLDEPAMRNGNVEINGVPFFLNERYLMKRQK